MKTELQFESLDDVLELQDGTRVSIRVEQDLDMGPPWEEHDGHGVISDWQRKERKLPGERILCTDHSFARFYDVQATTKIAKRDGWGCTDKTHDHKTKGEQAACAVEQDFERMRAWCNDDWHWAWVAIDLQRDGWEMKSAASCGGIDGDDDESYLLAMANELLPEALDHAS